MGAWCSLAGYASVKRFARHLSPMPLSLGAREDDDRFFSRYAFNWAYAFLKLGDGLFESPVGAEEYPFALQWATCNSVG